MRLAEPLPHDRPDDQEHADEHHEVAACAEGIGQEAWEGVIRGVGEQADGQQTKADAEEERHAPHAARSMEICQYII
jgi:hypothetical protein